MDVPSQQVVIHWLESLVNVVKWCLGFLFLGLASIVALLAALLHHVVESAEIRPAIGAHGAIPTAQASARYWSGWLATVAAVVACGLLICGILSFVGWPTGASPTSAP